jgi:threonine dehydrogenase-like Zn-dependent dehydrogenase
LKQLTLIEPERVEWLDVAAPAVEGNGDALVRPLAVAMCDLDIGIIRGEVPMPPPVALGHEFVAEVVEAGPAVKSVSAGDRVIVPFQISCGDCEPCRRGQTGSCKSVPPGSAYGFGAVGGDWGGALSDLVRVPFADAMLLPLPEGLEPAAVASVSDNVPDAWRTVAPGLERRAGAEVMIVGGGARSIALYAVEFADALGASRIVYLDDDQSRLELAGQLGAETVEGPLPKKAGSFPITVDAGGTRESLTCAIRSTESGGVCTSVGIVFEPETPVPLFEMYAKGIEFRIGRVQARAAIPSVLQLAKSGRINPERVTSRVASWEEAPDAVCELETKLVIARDA